VLTITNSLNTEDFMQDQSAQRRWALIVCSISAFVTPFMGASVSLALPAIGRDLNMTGVLLGWVATAYNLSAAMFLLPLGRLADIKGREIFFKLGLTVFTISSLLCAVAWDSNTLVAFRLLQGLGGGMIFGTSNAILAAYYPRDQRGKVFGVYTAALYLGTSVGPVLGGFLTQSLGWRSVFGLATALAFVAALLAFAKLPNRPVDVPGRVDVPGSAVYMLSLVLLMWGLSKITMPVGEMCVLAGAVGLFVFGVIESKTASPVFNVRAFRGNPAFIYSNLAALINIIATFALGFLVSLYLQYVKGMKPGHAALVMVIQTVVTTVLSLYTGKLSDKINPSILASIGMGLCAIGLGALIFLTPDTPVWYVVATLAFLGVGFALFSSPNTNAVMSSANKKDFGVASASLSTMRTLGMNLSMGVIMMLFSIFMGGKRITPELYGAYMKCMKIGFTIFTTLCVLGIYASLPRDKAKEVEELEEEAVHA
jgi:MFS family permease